MSFDTVDLLSGKIFQVTWDLGRRCNYDCSYCPAHRHDNFSKHATLDELKANIDFLFEYIDTYTEYRSFKEANIGFTGGEPTVNPNFIPFLRYLRQTYEKKYQDRWHAAFTVTSNGAMSEEMANAVIKHTDHITISYHAESNNMLKQQVRDRIMQFHTHGPENNCTVSVNVMFHAAYFDECKELCDYLHKNGVVYVPRVIGEEAGSKSNFSHLYTDAQLDYMKNYWKYKNAKLNDEKEVTSALSAVGKEQNEKHQVEKKEGWAIGRPCCGSREMCLIAKGKHRKGTFVDFRNFKGWNCSVNWFFLHLEQQTDSIFHHQTCQAKFDQTRGPIGKISEGKKIIAELKEKLSSGTMPTVICPKHTCGCGLCAPKSVYLDNYKTILARHVNMKIFDNTNFQKPNNVPIDPTEIL